jgi:SNF2 family DNA or RNA helicase
MQDMRAAAKSWTPHGYQERAIKFLLGSGQAGLLLPPGMGKTSTVLATAKILLQKKLIRRVLITAPLRTCYETWPAELCEWSDFHTMRLALLHDTNKERILRSLTPEHNIVVINPEGVPWLTETKARMKLLDADMLVVDESSLWKNSTAVRFKALKKYLHTFKRRYILTGSPRPRNYLDLHGQIYLLDMGNALGQYITHYRNRFFYPTGYQMREWELLPGMDEEINALVAPMVMRLEARDYLKLPKELERTHHIDLPAKARVEYDSIEDTLMSTLFTKPLISSASARSKCAQIANGSVYMDADPDEKWATKTRPSKVIHTAKVEALVDLYNELQGEPLLLGIGYHHDVVAIRKALGKGVPCINSNTTRKQAADFIDRWNKGFIPLLLGHPASMGHGLNLQKFNAQHVGFFDLPDNYDTYDQFFQRVCRQGNKAAFVMKHHFVVRGTVDVAKMRNLRNKGNGQKAFLLAMKEYTEERNKSRNRS